MPTISIHLPATTYKRLRARLGRGQNTSAFGRAAIEEKLTGRNAAGPRGLRTDYKSRAVSPRPPCQNGPPRPISFLEKIFF
ncbi:MAG: hypothetical protein LBC18_09095 [Opitutaceae bacterium]|nr:hypothetical protein [Opitutaceae bacterium]